MPAHGLVGPYFRPMSGERVRLAELLAALSLVFDLGVGRPLEHTLRATYLAGRLALRLALREDEREELFYTSILQNVGCHAYDHEGVSFFGADELVAAARLPFVSVDPLKRLRFVLSHAGSARPLYERPLVLARAAVRGSAVEREAGRTQCEVGALLARRLAIGEGVARALLARFEHWDGSGLNGVRGADIPLAVRIVAVTAHAEIFFSAMGEEAALDEVRAHEGTWFDPEIAQAFRSLVSERAPWGALDEPAFWTEVLALEPPARRRLVAEEHVDGVAEAFADFTDMKSPYFTGHARGVARLAERAARLLGLPDADVVAVRRAGFLHDLGRIAVSTTILEKPRGLSPAEQEKVRLHPYYTERVLARTPPLAALASLAGAHHERLDGSGYHRAARAPQLPLAARVLAATDACYALTEDRAHRRARSVDAAVSAVRDEARRNRLDGDCVEAVARAIGSRGRPPKTLPGLTAREVEVLRLLARAGAEKEIARELEVSQRTAHHHIEHVYAKLGVSTRAAAVLQAIARGLLDEELYAEELYAAPPDDA